MTGQLLARIEVRDVLDVAAVDRLKELVTVLETYRADPPFPHESVDNHRVSVAHY